MRVQLNMNQRLRRYSIYLENTQDRYVEDKSELLEPF